MHGDFDSAFHFYLYAAERGDPSGLYHVAKAYLNGSGVDPSKKKALKYLEKLIKSGCDLINVVYDAASIRMTPDVTERNHNFLGTNSIKSEETTAEAMERTKECAKLGLEHHINSQWRLRLGIEEWEVADCLSHALSVVGDHYLHGRFVAKNVREAINMLIQSARMNNIDALYLIAETYFFGKGVENDKDLAMKYYELAATRGSIKAKKRLDQIKEI